MDLDQLMGWVKPTEKQQDRILSSLPIPVLSDVYSSMKDSGRGKVRILSDYVKKLHGSFIGQVQAIGDCQNPTALVRMADGSEKEIQDISIGEYVLTPQGNIRKVIDRIKKPFTGKMVKVWVKGYHRPIESTPDHLYMTLPNIGRGKKNKDKNHIEWKPIVSLNEGDYVLLPKLPNLDCKKIYDLSDYVECITEDSDFKALRTKPVESGFIRQKKSSVEIKRYIELSEKLSYLIGAYAAEGSADYNKVGNCNRITFNLSSEEVLFALKIKQYIYDVFGFKAKITKVPSKPSVIYVRIDNTIISTFITKLCSGNVYTKNIDKSLLLTSKANKISLLTGWVDGDGHKSEQGVSVSKKLIEDIFQLCISVGINPTILKRKEYKQSKKSLNINFNRNAILLEESIKNKLITIKQFNKFTCELGKPAKIKKIEIVDPDTDFVYCIGVDEDHAFICNGYAIHNCVSFGSAHAIDHTYAFEILVKKERESWLGLTSTEDIYGGSRIQIGNGQLGNGDGSIGSWAAKYVSQYGTLLRQKYEKHDLSKYDPRRAKEWGSPRVGTPAYLLPIAYKTRIQTVSQVRTYEEARDAIYNGYAVTVASNVGFTSSRDSEGFLRRSGNWAHQMCFIGADDQYKRKGLLCLNSWPYSWVNGPTRHDMPPGSFWVDADVVNLMLGQGDSFAYSDRIGFPNKKIDISIWA